VLIAAAGEFFCDHNVKDLPPERRRLGKDRMQVNRRQDCGRATKQATASILLRFLRSKSLIELRRGLRSAPPSGGIRPSNQESTRQDDEPTAGAGRLRQPLHQSRPDHTDLPGGERTVVTFSDGSSIKTPEYDTALVARIRDRPPQP